LPMVPAAAMGTVIVPVAAPWPTIAVATVAEAVAPVRLPVVAVRHGGVSCVGGVCRFLRCMDGVSVVAGEKGNLCGSDWNP
jgi:hypothetical protein